MTHPTQPLYDLAAALAKSYGDGPRSYDAVRVVNALLNARVLAAIAERTSLHPDAVVEHLVAMARLLTATEQKS